MKKPRAESALRMLLGWAGETPDAYPFVRMLDDDERKKLKKIVQHILKDAPTEPDSPIERWVPLHEVTRGQL